MARKTGLKGLQEWAKHVTQGYRDVEITNMTTSFKSGLAFCAIIHKYRPELIPYNELKKDNVFDNNQLAFSVAESELDIPALLDAEDMVALAVPDKLSIATYLVQYYNYFKDKQPATSGTGVKGQNRTEPAPSPKRSKVEPVRAASSPVLPVKGKENTPVTSGGVKTAPAVNRVEQKNTASGQTEQPSQESSIRKGRRSKFKKPDEDESTGTLKRGTMGREECEVCGERVFLMERLAVESRVFHRACFKCCVCKMALKPGSYEHESNKFYCQQHYREALRQQTIKRTMAERGLSPSEEDTPIKPQRSKKFKKDEPKTNTPAKPAGPPGKVVTQSTAAKIEIPSTKSSIASSNALSKTTTATASSNAFKTTTVRSNALSKTTTVRSNALSKTTTVSSSAVVVSSKTTPSADSKDKPELTQSGEMKAALPSLLKSLATSKLNKEGDQSKPPQANNVTPNTSVTTPSKSSQTVLTPRANPVTVTSNTQQVKVTTPNRPQVSTTSSKPVEVSTANGAPPSKPQRQAKTNQPAKQTTIDPPKPPRMNRDAKSNETELPTVKLSSHIPNKPPPPYTGIPSRPPPPTGTRVLSHSKTEPSKVTEPKKPAEQVKPVPMLGDNSPTKPPRYKKTPDHMTPETSKQPGPVKRGSVKPKRPAPPRPTQPPAHKSKGQASKGVDLRVLSDKRKRRVGALKRQLADVEREQERLELRGVELEQQLRQKDDEAEDHLIEEWFALVNDKNMLVRQESDLVYELKDLELIDQHEVLDAEIRQRLAKDDSLKSEMERLEEEAMINELIELVEKRDKLLWTLHLEKTLDEEEDRQVELMTSMQAPPRLKQRSTTFM